LSGAAAVASLNTQLASSGITASIGSDGTLQFGGGTTFTVTAGALSGAGSATANAVSSTGTAVNSANYNVDTGTVVGIAAGTETDTFQNASGTYSVTFDDTSGASAASAVNQLNTSLAGSGISAVLDADGTGISLQSTSVFSVSSDQTTGGPTGSVFATPGPNTVTAASATASNTGSALAALTALTNAIASLGLVQGVVGAGENKLQYATNLAQSQITNYSAAESGIRDADVAAAAANLTKAQVLQQTSLAALSQANSSPQAVLSLLKNLS
jgi:flagellin